MVGRGTRRLSAINFFNLYIVIYQKGISSNFSSNFLIVIFKWLLLMGFSSFACCFIYYDLVKKKNYKIVTLLKKTTKNY